MADSHNCSLVEGDEMEALRSAARRFADEVIAPMIGTEGRDGDLGRLDALLSQAAELGIMASLDPETATHDYGVWGAASLAAGATASLLILEELACACAGVAGCVHFAGLGAAALAGAPYEGAQVDGARAAVVACPPRWAAIAHSGLQAEDQLQVRAGQIDGQARFVWSAPGSDTLVMFAAGEDGLERVAVRRDAAGLDLVQVQGRMGLEACGTHDVVATAAAGLRLGPGPVQEHWVQEHWVQEHWTRNWLGLCAIAIGNARGALAGAHAYAVERRQGGALIASHPAVQLLLGGAEACICTSRAALHQVGHRSHPDLRHAIMLKLRVTSDCAQAVSDCLQVLGGYGYMEDYRQEKRLRDALTLRSMAGRAADLTCRVARTYEGGAG